MIKTAYAVAVAAIVAGCFVAFPSLSASAPIGAKGDRADARPLGADCSQHAWPYYEANCLRDVRNPLATPRQVRMVSTDRVPDPVTSR